MDTRQIVLGLMYLVLGLVFILTRSRILARSRLLSLLWLFMGVVLTANGGLKIVQALGDG